MVLDDIGPGGKTGEPPVEPSYKLETSEQNGQWGYFLDPGSDFGLFEAVIEAIHQLGYGDEGAGGSYRVVRIPGSANLKAGKGEFRSGYQQTGQDPNAQAEGVADAIWDVTRPIFNRPAVHLAG